MRGLVVVGPRWRQEAEWFVRAGAPGGTGGESHRCRETAIVLQQKFEHPSPAAAPVEIETSSPLQRQAFAGPAGWLGQAGLDLGLVEYRLDQLGEAALQLLARRARAQLLHHHRHRNPNASEHRLARADRWIRFHQLWGRFTSR